MSKMCPCTLGNSVSAALNNFRKAKKLSQSEPEQTAAAVVLSRRVDTVYSLSQTSSSWAYLVKFRLEEGQEMELKTSEADYKKLKEDTVLSITWQGDALTAFVIELR